MRERSTVVALAARAALVVAVAVAASLAMAGPASATAASGQDEMEILHLHNTRRAQSGLAPLADDIAAREVARNWARYMAARGHIGHNPNLANDINRNVTTQWTRIGENVGLGSSPSHIEQAWWGSSTHRANILGQFNRVGVGAVRDGQNRLWVAVVFIQGPPLPVVTGAAWSPFSTPYALADQQYRDFLNRPGDHGGVDYWATLLRAGWWSAAHEIAWFMSSPEFAGVTAPIVRLYFAAFNRIPDQPGLQHWLSAFRGGMSQQTIADNFAGTAEFRNRYGSMSNAQFVDALYRNVFGRSADGGGLHYWAGALDSGRLTRGGVLLGMSWSLEYVHATHSEVVTTMAYVGMLRRSPDPSGFAHFVGRLDAGMPVANLVGGFLGSREYANRF